MLAWLRRFLYHLAGLPRAGPCYLCRTWVSEPPPGELVPVCPACLPEWVRLHGH